MFWAWPLMPTRADYLGITAPRLYEPDPYRY